MLNQRANRILLTISSLTSLIASGIVVADSEQEVLERIRPIGKINVAEPAHKVTADSVVTPSQSINAAPAIAPAPVAATTSIPIAPTSVAIDAPSVGQKTYDGMCFACHAVGAAGAPKFGDKVAWEPRIAKGMEVLLATVVKGTNTGMPARGGCGNCSDDDLKAAVEYMTAHAK